MTQRIKETPRSLADGTQTGVGKIPNTVLHAPGLDLTPASVPGGLDLGTCL